MKLTEHKNYTSLAKKLKVYNDLYDGDKEVMSSADYLPLYNIEKVTAIKKDKDGVITYSESGAGLRTIREQITGYTNHAKKFLRRYKSLIFKEEIQSDNIENLFDDINSVDGEETNFYDFLKDTLFTRRYVDGICYVLVDGKKESEEKYLQVIPAMQVKDWQYTDGQLTLFRYEYKKFKGRVSPEQEQVEGIYSDAYFINDTKEAVFNRYEKKDKNKNEWELIDSINLGIDFLPIAVLKGESFIKEFESDSLRYHRLKSSLDNQLYHQGTQKIFAMGNIDEQSVIAMGESTVSILKTVDGSIPSLQVIEPTNPVSLEAQIQESKETVITSAFHLTRIASSESKATEGFQAIAEQRKDLLEVLNSEIKSFEKFVNQILNIYWQVTGSVPSKKASITMKKDITIIDVAQVLQEELAYFEEIKKYPTWYKALLGRVVDRLGFEKETEQEVKKEIEELSDQVRESQATFRGIDFSNVGK